MGVQKNFRVVYCWRHEKSLHKSIHCSVVVIDGFRVVCVDWYGTGILFAEFGCLFLLYYWQLSRECGQLHENLLQEFMAGGNRIIL